MSDIKLPELPKPWDLQHDEDGRPQVLYTADQLREYAKQAAELERERILGLLRDVEEPAWYGSESPYDFYGGVAACMRAIRGTK